MESIKLSIEELKDVLNQLPEKESKYFRLKHAISIPILNNNNLGYKCKELTFKLNTKLEWKSLQKIEIE